MSKDSKDLEAAPPRSFSASDGQAVLGLEFEQGLEGTLRGFTGVRCGYSRLPGTVGRRWRELHPHSFAVFPFFEDLYSVLSAKEEQLSRESKGGKVRTGGYSYALVEGEEIHEDSDYVSVEEEEEEDDDGSSKSRVLRELEKPMLEISLDDNAGTLLLAARSGDAVLCKAVQLRSSWESCVDGLGMTPLHLAAAFGHANCMGVLLAGPARSGWDVHATPIDDEPGVTAADLLRVCHPELLAEWKDKLTHPNWQPVCLLHEAVYKGSLEHVDFLIEAFKDEAGEIREECVNQLGYLSTQLSNGGSCEDAASMTALDLLLTEQGRQSDTEHDALMLKLIQAGGRCSKDSSIIQIDNRTPALVNALLRNPSAVDRLKLVSLDDTLLADIAEIIFSRHRDFPLKELDMSAEGINLDNVAQLGTLAKRANNLGDKVDFRSFAKPMEKDVTLQMHLKVRSLDLSGRVNDRAVAQLVIALTEIPRKASLLQHCNMSSGSIHDAGAGMLAAAIALTIETDSRITRSEVQSKADWLPTEFLQQFGKTIEYSSTAIQQLQTLDLGGNPMTEIGVGYILRALVLAEQKIQLHVRLFGIRVNISSVMSRLELTPTESKKLSARVDLLRDQFLLEQAAESSSGHSSGQLERALVAGTVEEDSHGMREPLLGEGWCFDMCNPRRIVPWTPAEVDDRRGSRKKKSPFEPPDAENLSAKARRDRGILGHPGTLKPLQIKRAKNPPAIDAKISVTPLSEAGRLEYRDAVLKQLLHEHVAPRIKGCDQAVWPREKQREFLIKETLRIAEYKASERSQCCLAASQGKDACDLISVVPRSLQLPSELSSGGAEGDDEEGEGEESEEGGKEGEGKKGEDIVVISMKDIEELKTIKMDMSSKNEVAARESGGFDLDFKPLPAEEYGSIFAKQEEEEQEEDQAAPAETTKPFEKPEVPVSELRTLNISAMQSVTFKNPLISSQENDVQHGGFCADSPVSQVIIILALFTGASCAAVSCGPIMRKLADQLVKYMPLVSSVAQIQVALDSQQVSRQWMCEALFLALPVAVLAGMLFYWNFRSWLKFEISTMRRSSKCCLSFCSMMRFLVLLIFTSCVQIPVALTEGLLCYFNCPGSGGQSGACDTYARGMLFISPLRLVKHFPPEGTEQGRIDTAMLSACMAICGSYGFLLWRIERGKLNPQLDLDVSQHRVTDFVAVQGAPGLLAVSLNGKYNVVPNLQSEELPVFRKQTYKNDRWLYAVPGQDANLVDWCLTGSPPFTEESRSIELTNFVSKKETSDVMDTIKKKNAYRTVDVGGLTGDGAIFNGSYLLTEVRPDKADEVKMPKWQRRGNDGSLLFLILSKGKWKLTDKDPTETQSQALIDRILLFSMAKLKGASKRHGVSGLMHDGVWRVRVDDHKQEEPSILWVAPSLKASKEHTSAWRPFYGHPLFNLNSSFGLTTLANLASMVLDVILDAFVVWSYWTMNLPFFFGIALGIMFAPPLFLWAFMYSLGMMTFFDLFLCLTQTKIFVDAYRTLRSGQKSLDLIWTVVSEACFESAPQSIIQTYCLLLNFSEISAGGTLFLFSILWSLLNVAKAVAYLDFHSSHTSSSAFAVRLLVRFCEVSSRVSSLALFAMFFRSSKAGLHENKQKAVFILLAIDAFIMWLLIHFKAPQGGIINCFWALLSCLVAPPIFVSQFRALQPYYYAVRFLELCGMIVAGALSGHGKHKLVATKESQFFVGVFLVSTLIFLLVILTTCLVHGPGYLKRLASGRILRLRMTQKGDALSMQFEHTDGTVDTLESEGKADPEGEQAAVAIRDHLEMLAGEEVIKVTEDEMQDGGPHVTVLTNFGRAFPYPRTYREGS